jgi:lysophospholipase L1-like esterase
MKTKFLLIISLLFNILFLITCAYIFRDKWIQKMVAIQGDAKIVMFGNSLTAQGKWVELLGRTDVHNSGFPGLCTYHFLSLVRPQVLHKNPSVCFVEAGINDITVGVTQEKIQQNYQQILESIMAQGIKPVVTLTLYEQNDPVSKSEVMRLNEFLMTYCQKNQIEYLDLNQYLSDSTGLKPQYARDKTHLNTEAYKIWAREVGKILKKMEI